MRGGPRRLAVRLVSQGPRVGPHAPAHTLAISWANAPMRSASASSWAAAPFTMKPSRRTATCKSSAAASSALTEGWSTAHDRNQLEAEASACGVRKPDRARAEGMVGLPRLRRVVGLCPLD